MPTPLAMYPALSILKLAVLFGLASSASPSDVVLCGKYENYTTPSGAFTFSTNQWGADGSGEDCITIFNNGTMFNSTWKWSHNPQSVHSFPNINLNSAKLPLQLSNLSALNIGASWTMAPASRTKKKSLAAISAAADVVVDMFADLDPTRADSTTLPQYEVMIWFAAFDGKKPIGYSSSITNPPTQTLNDTDFSLYMGPNTNGQYVYSWLASSNVNNFDTDISPLLHYLWREKYISESNYLGVVQFGSETFHATSNVTFSVRNFNMSIEAGTPKPTTSAATPSSTSSSAPNPKKSQASGRFNPSLALVMMVTTICTICSWVILGT